MAICLMCAAGIRAQALTAGRGEREEVGAEPTGTSDRPWEPCPYPPSETIAGIEFEVSTRRTEAPGSDIWPITWADDDHQ